MSLLGQYVLPINIPGGHLLCLGGCGRRYYPSEVKTSGLKMCNTCREAQGLGSLGRKALPSAPCGTRAAAAQHRRLGEPPCDACRDACNQADREYNRQPDVKQAKKRAWRRLRGMPEDGYPEGQCPTCEAPFKPYNEAHQYCSSWCRIAAQHYNRAEWLRLLTPERRAEIVDRMANLVRECEATKATRYNGQHRAARLEHIAKMSPDDPCPRCGEAIGDDPTQLDLDHDDLDPTRYLGLSHASCNRGASRGGAGISKRRWRPALDLDNP